MLELIFRGFLEWIYVLLVEIWEFIAGGLLDIMGLDFAYLQTHIPIMDDMARVLLAAGWALLLGNLVFQALKSMAAGLGFEGEDPKLLFARTFVFAFLLLASPQICRIGLDLTSNIMDLLRIPDATDVKLVDESVFGALGAAWIMAIICSVIVMFKVLGLVIEIAERYVILAMLTLTAPLAFAMGGSKNTASIFTGWCRMFGSMCLLMVTNLVCFKMLFSVVSTVPSGLDVLPWMVLIFAIVKVAKKSDAIITRIGLNPAITGGPGRTLPGMLAYTVVRTAVSGVAKGVTGGGFGGGRTASASASGTRPGRPSGSTRFNGSRFSTGAGGRFGGTWGGGRSNGGQASGSGAQDGGRPDDSFGGGRSFGGGGRHSGAGDSSQNFGGTHGGGRYTYHSTGQQNSTQQTNTRQENSSQTATRSGNTNTAASNTPRGGGRPQQTRKSSVSPGARHPHSYVPHGASAGGQSAPGQNRASTTRRPNTPRLDGAGTTPKGGGSRPGPAGTAPKISTPKQPNAAQSGAAGTGASRQSARSTHSASHTAGGSTVSSTSQTNVTVGGKVSSSAPKAPAGTSRAPHPGGPAVPKSGGKPGKARTTRREDSGVVPKTPGAPGVSQPGFAGKPSRSTQRPSEPAPRPSRNAAPATATSPPGGTPSSPAPQGRTSSSSRTTVNGSSPSPARQEPRKPSTSGASPVKGSAPTIRPGGAGTAHAGKQAAGQARTAKARTARAQSAHRPPPNRRGGNNHG